MSEHKRTLLIESHATHPYSQDLLSKSLSRHVVIPSWPIHNLWGGGQGGAKNSDLPGLVAISEGDPATM